MGFIGFCTINGEIFPNAFFIFFGFFSFFFEGKLSHILEDELFQENKRKAQLEAYRIGFKLLFVVIWLMAIGMFSRNVEWCAIFMLISAFYLSTNPQEFWKSVRKIQSLKISRILPGHHHLSVPVTIIDKIETAFHNLSNEGKLKQGNDIFSYERFQIHI